MEQLSLLAPAIVGLAVAIASQAYVRWICRSRRKTEVKPVKGVLSE